jgi:polyribonucleotide nucleotidyltransferase
LNRTHGSALFTRGETQALAVATLGTVYDEQILDNIDTDERKRFMLHYNFPPFSVGETGRLATGRREIGHGNLAERSIERMLPSKEVFPYTLRVVSEVLESNGSSSMATVCGTTLCLLDAGVPIEKSVAGIAMGLIRENDKHVILSDILGEEDHLGDMDFKVAGTRDGITAFQMDIKIGGIDPAILRVALDQAKRGRLHILSIMEEIIKTPRDKISEYAPKIISIKINPEKIGLVIGPGGKTIKGITEKTEAVIDIEDNGNAVIYCKDSAGAEKAKEMIAALIEEPEVGRIYDGVVKRIMDFGAFIEFMPGKEGLCHISNLSYKPVHSVSDFLKVGDELKVKLVEIDRMGRMNLSHKETLPDTEENRADRERESEERNNEPRGEYRRDSYRRDSNRGDSNRGDSHRGDRPRHDRYEGGGGGGGRSGGNRRDYSGPRRG